MTRRRAVSALGLAMLFAITIAAPAQTRPVAASDPAVEAYRVMLVLPDRQSSTAIVIVEHEVNGLAGTLVVDGSRASALQNVRIENGVLTAQVATTAGIADLRMELVDRTGTATLSMRDGSSRSFKR